MVVNLSTSPIPRQMGETIALECTIEGNPTPTITWWFNGAMLDTAPSRFNTSVSGNITTLTIMPLVGDDTGNYQCRGMNVIGNSTSDMVSITVQGEWWICVCQ